MKISYGPKFQHSLKTVLIPVSSPIHMTPNSNKQAPQRGTFSSASTKINSIPKHPVVLCHGLFGFVNAFDPFSGMFPTLPPLHYFRGVVTHLQALGCTVITPAVSPVASIRSRAESLRLQLQAARKSGLWKTSHMHLIGHSMGGLDARYLVSKLDMADQVRTVTSLVSPHRGSSMANWVLNLSPMARKYLNQWSTDRNMDIQAIENLTPDYMIQEFNKHVLDHPDIKYFLFSASKPNDEISIALRWCHSIISREEGENDGLVSVESAKWGQHIRTLYCDHNELINWSFTLGGQAPRLAQPFETLKFYRELMSMLAYEEAIAEGRVETNKV